MENLIKRISDYDIINTLLPGIIFFESIKLIYGISLPNSDLIINVFVYYFAGLVIARIGSLVLESILKGIKLINFTSPQKYYKAESLNPKVSTLNMYANLYRSFSSEFLIMSVMCLICKEYSIPAQRYQIVSSLLLISMLFILSYIKQVKYIVSNVNSTLENKN